MVAQVDIYNMAMAHLGSRQVIANTSEDSAECRACNTFYATALSLLVGECEWSYATNYKILDGCDTKQTLSATLSALDQTSDEITMAGAFIDWTATAVGFTGTAILEVSTDDGDNWSAVATVTASATVASTPINLTTAGLYRWRCSAYTAGSIVMSLTMRGNDRYRYQYALPSDYLKSRYIYPQPYNWPRVPTPRIPFEVADNGGGTLVLYADEADIALCYTKAVTDLSLLGSDGVMALSYLLAMLCAMSISRKEEVRDQCERLYTKAVNAAYAKDCNSQVDDMPWDGESAQARL